MSGPAISLDLVQSADAADYVLLRELAPLEGAGEAPPLVGIAGLAVNRVRAANGGHTQLTLRRGREVVDGIAFGRADLAEQLTEGSEIDVVARLASRTFAGLETLQLEVRDVAPAGWLRAMRTAWSDEPMTQPPQGPRSRLLGYPPGAPGYQPDQGHAPATLSAWAGASSAASSRAAHRRSSRPSWPSSRCCSWPAPASGIVSFLDANIETAAADATDAPAATQAAPETPVPEDTEAPATDDPGQEPEPTDELDEETPEPETTAEPILVVPPSDERADITGSLLFTRLVAISGRPRARRLTTLTDSNSTKADSSPTWSPDGKYIYFIRSAKKDVKSGKARFDGKYTLYPTDLCA